MAAKSIGLVIPNLQKGGWQELLDAIGRYAQQSGFKTLCFSSFTDLYQKTDSDRGEASIFSLAKKAELCGIVIFSELIKDDDISKMLIEHANFLGIPVFCIEKFMPGCYNIGFDYDEAFERMTSHVIEHHGAKNLHMISGLRDNPFSNTRNAAFKRALESHGLPFDDSLISYGEFWEGPTRRELEKICADRDNMPDAIICANDVMAIAACCYFEERGILVPDDVIVTGFDGIERASQCHPTITTAKRDYDAAAKYAVEVISSLAEGKSPSCCDKLFSLNIIAAQSCGCQDMNERVSMKTTSKLYDFIYERQDFRMYMDHMTLRLNNGKGLVDLINSIGKYAVTVMHIGMAIYIDPSFFGNPTEAKSELILAAYIDPKTVDYHPVMAEFSESGIFSQEIFGDCNNLLFVPLHCQDRVYGYIVTEFRYLDLVGSERLYDFTVHLNMLLSSVENSSKLSEMVSALNEMYISDQLTNMLNRRGFYRKIDELLLSAQGEQNTFMIVSVDLDGLKYINDNYGHFEGDFAIVSIADILKEMTAERGICARFGGDEYLAVLVGENDPILFEKELQSRIAELNESSGKPYSVGASIGVELVSSADAVSDLQDVIRRADNKMYRSKKRSRLSRSLRFGKQ